VNGDEDEEDEEKRRKRGRVGGEEDEDERKHSSRAHKVSSPLDTPVASHVPGIGARHVCYFLPGGLMIRGFAE
jgi:hypothetical protein